MGYAEDSSESISGICQIRTHKRIPKWGATAHGTTKVFSRSNDPHCSDWNWPPWFHLEYWIGLEGVKS
jgi:hypothetical protein